MSRDICKWRNLEKCLPVVHAPFNECKQTHFNKTNHNSALYHVTYIFLKYGKIVLMIKIVY